MNKKNMLIPLCIVTGILLFIGGLSLGLHINLEKDNKNNKNNENIEKNNNDNSFNDIVSDIKYFDVDVNTLKISAKENSELNNNIQIIKSFMNNSSNYLNVLAKNNNSTPVTVSYELNFYDNEGYNIDNKANVAYMVMPGKEFVMEFWTSYKKDYDSIDVKYDAKKGASYYTSSNLTDNDLKYIQTASEIEVQYTNNSDKDLYTMNATCIFYNKDEIVYAKNVYMGEAKAGMTNSGNCYTYNLNNIEYDNYKVLLTSAYYYDKNGW